MLSVPSWPAILLDRNRPVARFSSDCREIRICRFRNEIHAAWTRVRRSPCRTCLLPHSAEWPDSSAPAPIRIDQMTMMLYSSRDMAAGCVAAARDHAVPSDPRVHACREEPSIDIRTSCPLYVFTMDVCVPHQSTSDPHVHKGNSHEVRLSFPRR